MRTLILLMVLAACRPEKVVNPHDHVASRTNPEVQQDVGAKAPDSSPVQARDGSTIELAHAWADNRVVLVFYMGHWCPECQHQLAALNDRQKDFADKHTTVIAVSTDSPQDAGALKDKMGLTFDVYSDTQLQTIAKWGVADYDTNIAKPSTFVIQKGGAISFKKIGQSTTDRPTVDDILAQLPDSK
ncbi:MAG TPA: redoxin domain-containing protein [Kofleriaceae bacterium]|nr:redoxin domain-containing protein [Kofleriaceae bacterium]